MKGIKDKINFKKKKKGRSFEFFLIIFCIIFTNGILLFSLYLINNKHIFLDKIEKEIIGTYKSVKNSYYEDINLDELKNAAINGMMDYLGEDYSKFMDKEDNQYLDELLNGKYKGIGITISIVNNQAIILAVQEDSPASNAGLQANDILVSIDGTEITAENLSNINSLVKDKNKISVEIIRDKETIMKDIMVKTLNKPVITTKTFTKNDKLVGYIYIEAFSNTSAIQFRQALERLEKEKIDALIIDVRNNTGGYLEAARDISSMFIEKGKILYQLDTRSKVQKITDKTSESRDYEVAIIINQISASASEVLALSLKESYGAYVVGINSFGKGKVQQVDKLSKDEKVKLTSAKWYSPNGNSIDEVGIVPGIYVTLDKKYALEPNDDNDLQLQKAIKILTDN